MCINVYKEQFLSIAETNSSQFKRKGEGMNKKKVIVGILILIGIIAILFINYLYEQQLLNNQVALVLTILTFLIIFPIIHFVEK